VKCRASQTLLDRPIAHYAKVSRMGSYQEVERQGNLRLDNGWFDQRVNLAVPRHLVMTNMGSTSSQKKKTSAVYVEVNLRT